MFFAYLSWKSADFRVILKAFGIPEFMNEPLGKKLVRDKLKYDALPKVRI